MPSISLWHNTRRKRPFLSRPPMAIMAGLWPGRQGKNFYAKGSEPCRVEAIRAIENAEATVLDMNYDQAVLYAFDYANQHGFTAIQDTGFEGYEQVPNWITQGYTTMTKEALAQMQQYGTQRPSHVFVQAGVGSFAGSITGYLAHVYGDKLPHITIVEASPAACLYRSIECGDGAPHSITGDPETIMAGQTAVRPICLHGLFCAILPHSLPNAWIGSLSSV